MYLTPELDAALRECLLRFDEYQSVAYGGRTEAYDAAQPVLCAVLTVYDRYNAAARAQGLPVIDAYRWEGADGR